MKTNRKTKNRRFRKRYNKKKGGDDDENKTMSSTLRIKPTTETTSIIHEITNPAKFTVRNKPNSIGRTRNRVLSNFYSKAKSLLPFQKKIAIDEKEDEDVKTDLTEKSTESSDVQYNPLIKFRAGRKNNKRKTKNKKRNN